MTAPRLRRRIAWAIFVLCIVSGVIVLLLFASPRAEVEVAKVTRGTFTRHVEESGRVSVRDRYVISAPVAGTLERIVLRVGEQVARGDRLAVLHPVASPLLDAKARAQLVAQRGAAEASLASARTLAERAEAARAHAEAEVRRAHELERSNTAARRDIEHAELELTLADRERDAARLAAHLAEHELEMARAALDVAGSGDVPLVIQAPADGRVLRVYQQSESVLGPGQPILELGDPRAVEIVVDLLSADAVQVEPGIDAEITGWGGSAVLRGRVRLVEPVATVRLSALGVEERRVDVVIDPVDRDQAFARVGDGYHVDVRLPIERVNHVLRLPTSALFRQNETWCAFVVDRDSRVHRVTVAVARYGPLESVVSKGLAEGSVVVTDPPDELSDGDQVEVLGAAKNRH